MRALRFKARTECFFTTAAGVQAREQFAGAEQDVTLSDPMVLEPELTPTLRCWL
jgi:hypothetical protein